MSMVTYYESPLENLHTLYYTRLHSALDVTIHIGDNEWDNSLTFKYVAL